MVQIFTQFDFGCDNLSGASVNSGTVGGIDGLASLGSNWNALLQAQVFFFHSFIPFIS